MLHSVQQSRPAAERQWTKGQVFLLIIIPIVDVSKAQSKLLRQSDIVFNGTAIVHHIRFGAKARRSGNNSATINNGRLRGQDKRVINPQIMPRAELMSELPGELMGLVRV